MSIKTNIQRNLILMPGWRSNRKIVVIESDDWGSIRMSDAKTLANLSRTNPELLKDPMSRLDSLESEDDLTAMFEVLQSVKDGKGKPAILTANTIVANPDFDRIAASNFMEYSYENFTETLKRYPGRNRVMELITQGINSEIYKPQFHGREHVNVPQWMQSLQSGNKELQEAFKYRLFGIPLTEKVSKRKNLMAALDFENVSEQKEKDTIIQDGTAIFENIFGFRSKSYIATSYIWDRFIEEELQKNGISYIQGIPYQYIPNPGGKWYKRKFHYTGQINPLGQIYLIRNASFEPSLTPEVDTVGECLNRIELAFKWGKPAIIGSHRINFIGSIEELNREKNLKLFRELLNKIVLKWPEVEFMSSDQLGDLIKNS